MRDTNREIIIGLAGFMAALIIVGGGLWWHARASRHQLTGSQAAAAATQSAPSDASGLSVSGQASNLGQLGANAPRGQSSGNGTGSGSSSGVDPSTFGQYNKYQNNKDALFADITKGNGGTLAAGKQANVYYTVWLTDGTLVDRSPASSSGQPQPFSFTIGAHQVIPGLEEGVYGMLAGGERLVIVPPAVGYGAQGQGAIPPNAVLVFDIQLIGVQ